MAKLQNKTIYASLAWNFFERICVECVQLVISIILARILLPEDYGILALITIFISISTVIVETGLSSSIINKEDITKKQINFIFSISLLASIVLYAVIFFGAPLIAKFYDAYNSTLLIKLLRVYSLVLPIGAITSVQMAVVHKNMQFKKMFFVNFISVIVSGAIGVFLAVNDYGVWALIAQQMTSKAILFISLTLILKWIPTLGKPDKESWGMIKYGSNILGLGLFNVVYNQFSSITVGKIYTPNSLAFYNKAQTFPSMIATNTDYSMQKVMFSAYSKEKDDINRIKEMMRNTISIISFILFPLLLGMFATTENIVYCLLSEKWIPSVPYMRLFCLFYLLQPFKTTGAQALNGIGKSKLSLRVGIVSKSIGICLMLSTVWFGLVYLLIGLIVSEIIASIFYCFLNKKYFNYTIGEQIKDFMPSLICSSIMCILVVMIGETMQSLAPIITLIIQCLSGIIIYFVASLLFNRKILNTLKTIFKKKEKKDETLSG